MAKYTYEDIIIDPEDERLEIGAEYFCCLLPYTCLRSANNGGMALKLGEVRKGDDCPFVTYGESAWCCLIRKKEETE